MVAREGWTRPRGAIGVGSGGYGDHPIWQDGAHQLKHLIIPGIGVKSSNFLKKYISKLCFFEIPS
jgi:hypothetical protein